ALLRLHGLRAYVAAAEAVGLFDAIDCLIGAVSRLGHGLAHRADVQHAPAVGEDGVILRDGAGVEDFHAVDPHGVIEPVDARALPVVAGIALRGHDHGDRRLGVPA